MVNALTNFYFFYLLQREHSTNCFLWQLLFFISFHFHLLAKIHK